MTGPANARDLRLEQRLLDRIDGTRLSVGHHHPFLLDDPRRIWLVLSGHVDLFAVPLAADRVAGTGVHLLRIEAGELLFGLPSVPDPEGGPDDRIALRAVAAMGSELFGAERAGIAGKDFDILVVDWIDRWIARLAEALAPVGGPRAAGFLDADPDVAVRAGTVLVPQKGDVIWIRPETGTAAVPPVGPLDAGEAAPWLPLAGNLWLRCETDCTLSGLYTPTVLHRQTLWRDLDRFHARFMQAIAAGVQRRRQAAADRLAERVRANRARFGGALRRIAAILRPDAPELPDAAATGDPLYEAARLVGAASGLTLAPPAPEGASGARADPLDEIARRSHIRVRRVVLFDDWYRRDNGPLIAWRAEDAQPVALLPERPDRYRLVDPLTGRSSVVTRETAERLTGTAHVLYQPFPPQPLRIREVFAFGLRNQRRDGLTLLVMGLLTGLLALATPIATGAIFSSIIPRADLEMHLMTIAGLALAAFGAAVFAVARGFAALRIQSRMDARIQTAVWDRLLALPAPFFRDYTAGDLADRANGINLIRELLSGTATQSILNILFSAFSLALLFWYDWTLALAALAVVLVMLALSFAVTWMQVPLQREAIARGGRIEGLVFQLLSGIAKLRISAGEARAFARWADQFGEVKSLTWRIRQLAALQSVLTTLLFPLLAAILLYAIIGFVLNRDDEGQAIAAFGVGDFLTFNAAFGQFGAAMLGLLNSLTVLIVIVPLYERVRPILEAIPEVSEIKADPGPLDGTVELSRLTFRYAPDAPPALDEVSVLIPSGAYVAFVGASGSGKSTLIRLILGFERPESGGVYLDGNDLSGLDLPLTRRQIGVVLQNGRLMPGSIFDNIVGSLPLKHEDAWEAARAAGLEDDIKAMPMGMHTVLSQGAGTLSGGQRQRLTIARALVHKPRILILDEATSALDNRTQELVNASLARMNMTRIVVAHRLSTIQNVDRIFVMRQGRIVEEGTFSALMARDGEFAELARRQMI